MKIKKKINLGIVGKNFGYNVIYKSFQKNKNFKIVGFSFKSKINYSIKISKKIKIYSSWKKLILNKSIDAIAIASPPTSHKNIIKFAIKNKKHIFCEKPFTCSFNEANYICKLIKQKKLSHIVNYEFVEIDAFQIFKNNILNKKNKIDKIKIDWFLNIKRKKNTWKEYHSKGGGIMFNYACHAIYYLEFFFGKIISTKSLISYKNKKSINAINSNIFFKSGLSAELKVKILSKNSKDKPIHQVKVRSNKKIYLLRSFLNSLTNQFEIIKITKNKNQCLFKNKNSKIDFRIKPSFRNSKKFSSWILNNKIQNPNFFDAKRIHFIIDQMILSSKERKKIYIN